MSYLIFSYKLGCNNREPDEWVGMWVVCMVKFSYMMMKSLVWKKKDVGFYKIIVLLLKTKYKNKYK